MYTSGDRGTRQVASHELQKGHLCGGVLHIGTVGLELEIGTATNVATAIGVGEQVLLWLVQVRVENLLRKGKATGAEDATNLGIFVVEGLVGRW